MRKLYFLFLTVLISGMSFGQDLVMTGIIDGPLPGGFPKSVELYVVNNIADLSVYGLERAGNGNASSGAQTYTFPADAKTAGDYIYVSPETDFFTQYLGVAPTYIVDSGELNNNGDDTVLLYANGAVSDAIGVLEVDGSGEAWEYLDGWMYRVDGNGPSATFNVAEWTFSGANALDGCDLDDDTGTNAGCASVYPLGTYSAEGSTEPSIVITAPTDNQEFAPGTSSVSVDISVQNFNVANGTGDGHIRQVLTTPGGTFDEFKYDTDSQSISVADGESYTIYMELVDNAGNPINPAVNQTVNFSVLSSNNVSTIAELRAGTIGEVYTLTGEALITYLTGFRNQKHIEDATAGILIDDSSGTITSSYALGDGIMGLAGTLGEFSNTLQFVPVADPGTASSTGNTLTPQTVTFAQLNASPEDYESEFVKVEAVTFDNAEVNFFNGLEIAMTQSADMFNFRTAFNEDYSEGIVPTTAADVSGIILDRSGSYFLMARYALDFSVDVLSVEGFENSIFSVYPNPASNGKVTINSANSGELNVVAYDILGKQVVNTVLVNTTLDVSNLKAGVYILKLSQGNASVTKKLVIK
jgi:hypothetical protein